MMRWKVIVGCLVLTLAVTAGCKQELFITECDRDHYPQLGSPACAECNPVSIEGPTTNMEVPSTTEDPNRHVRYLTLPEALAMALEHGTTGIQSVRLLGTSNDDMLTFQGAPPLIQASDAIRVLALEPAAIGTEIEASLAKFDAFWRTSLTYNSVDQPNAISGQAAFSNGFFSNFLTQVVKPLAGGGDAGVTFNVNYQDLSHPPTTTSTTLNPTYQPNLTFFFDQPLLQGWGVDVNELRTIHPLENPGSTLSNVLRPPNSTLLNGNTVPGVLITRLRFDQSRAEFERVVDFMLVNVETAYWNLYGAYVSLYATEQGMRQAYKIWRITKAQFDAGKIGAKDYYPQLGQYEQFRGDRLEALNNILERERILRALIGLPASDCDRLIPIDAPTLTPFQPCWHVAVNECLSLRPELIIGREDLKLRQLEVLREKNNLLPDLRFNSNYTISGLGTSLSGTANTANDMPANAFQSLASNHFDSWALGLSLNVPIGYRAAYASIRQARLRLAQGYLQVHDMEDKATRFLVQQYRLIYQSYADIQARRSQRVAYGEQLRAKIAEIEAGKAVPDLSLLDALRQWTTALNQEYQNVVNYNNALAAFEFAKGTLLQHDNINISDGPLPCCASVRAVEHEEQRKRALLCKERANPQDYIKCQGGAFTLPELSPHAAPPLPALLPADKGTSLDVPERLPETPAQQGLPAPRPEPTALEAAAPPAAPAVTPAPAAAGISLPAAVETAAPVPSLPASVPAEAGAEQTMTFSREPLTSPASLPPTAMAPTGNP